MPILKRRSRMISFRVSEDEYVGLKNLCINKGARSVSDMARDAVHRLMNNHSWPNNQLEFVVQVLQVRIEALDIEVKRLSMALNSEAPARNGTVRSGNGDN